MKTFDINSITKEQRNRLVALTEELEFLSMDFGSAGHYYITCKDSDVETVCGMFREVGLFDDQWIDIADI